ncbi:MAG: S8 family serine peptidase [Ilumatobacteraceae bacterium]
MPAVSAWCSSTPRPTRSTATSTSCRRSTSTPTCVPPLLAYVSGTRRPASSLSPEQCRSLTRRRRSRRCSPRGPLRASSDLLKPDITAPGVDVLAAVSPDGYFGRNYDLLSGTSMSSPHMAGLSLVVKSARPNWTPAETKSALMTSAYAVDGASPFDVGSGHVSINRAIASPLVYPAGVNDYFGFLCGLGEIDNPSLCANNNIEVSDLNQPNIAVGQLAGTRTVTRRIKNSGTKTATFRSTVAAPPGVDVAVAPSQLRLNPGQTKSFRVTFTANSGAVFDEYSFGKLTWKAPTTCEGGERARRPSGSQLDVPSGGQRHRRGGRGRVRHHVRLHRPVRRRAPTA